MGILVQLGSEFGLIMTWSLRLFTRTALLVVSVSGAPTEDTGDETPDTGSQGYQGPPSQYTKPYNSFSAPQSSIVPSWPQAPSQGWQRPSYNTKPYLSQVPKDPRNYMPSQSVSGVEPISSASSDPAIHSASQHSSLSLPSISIIFLSMWIKHELLSLWRWLQPWIRYWKHRIQPWLRKQKFRIQPRLWKRKFRIQPRLWNWKFWIQPRLWNWKF